MIRCQGSRRGIKGKLDLGHLPTGGWGGGIAFANQASSPQGTTRRFPHHPGQGLARHWGQEGGTIDPGCSQPQDPQFLTGPSPWFRQESESPRGPRFPGQ